MYNGRSGGHMANIFFKKTGKQPSQLALIAFLCAVLAAAAMVVAGPAYVQGLYGAGDNNPADLSLRFQTVMAAAGLSLAALVFALVASIHSAMSAKRRGSWRTVVSALVGAAVFVPFALMAKAGGDYPPIHDVMTDIDNPPRFFVLEPRFYDPESRRGYAGSRLASSFQAQHRSAYGGLKPVDTSFSVESVTTLAGSVALALGWDVVETDLTAGLVEARVITRWFGFEDRIAIRVVPTALGSRLDVRSQSMVGISDLGANAKRIKAFLDLMKSRLTELEES